MRTVVASPSDLSTVPWQPGCSGCGALIDDPQPGLFSWVVAVGNHFEGVHGIALVR